jgi:hypothetical protein
LAVAKLAYGPITLKDFAEDENFNFEFDENNYRKKNPEPAAAFQPVFIIGKFCSCCIFSFFVLSLFLFRYVLKRTHRTTAGFLPVFVIF